jgi:uncharacterized protein (TIGR02246 family)
VCFELGTRRLGLPVLRRLVEEESQVEGEYRMGDGHHAPGTSNNLGRSASVDDKTTANPADEAAIRGLFHNLLDDWGKGDGYSYGSRFTEDADYVAFDGSRTKGREEIASWHQQLFDKYLKGSSLTGRVEGVRFLGPDVALMHALGSTVMRDKTEPSPERDSIQTFVAVKRNGEWLFAAFHNTRLRPIGNAGTFLVWALSDWLWKIFRLNKSSSRPRDADWFPTFARPRRP